MGTTLHELSLAHLSVLDATPPELVTVAAAAGFRKIGIRLSATPSVGIPPYDMLGDTPVMRETLRRLAATGVSTSSSCASSRRSRRAFRTVSSKAARGSVRSTSLS